MDVEVSARLELDLHRHERCHDPTEAKRTTVPRTALLAEQGFDADAFRTTDGSHFHRRSSLQWPLLRGIRVIGAAGLVPPQTVNPTQFVHVRIGPSGRTYTGDLTSCPARRAAVVCSLFTCW